MKIAPETFTVVPHPADGELSLLIAGLRIVLDLDEARALTAQLISGMKAICRVERVGDRIARPAPEPEPVVVEPVMRQPASAELEPAAAPASRSALAAAQDNALAAVEERLARDERAAVSSAEAPAPAEPAPASLPAEPPRPVQDVVEADKKSNKKLRSLLKALVKEDDSSFSGGL